MRTVFACALLLMITASVPGGTLKTRRTPTWCAEDGSAFGLMDYPASAFVSYVGGNGDELHARYLDSDDFAEFSIWRQGSVLDTIRIHGMSNPNGWLTRSANGKRFAITWSNGGAAGGWTAQVFHFSEEGKFVEDAAVKKKVEREFSSKHDCKTRGDNYRALRWLDNDRLLLSAEVYPTSDCGAQMGFTQGYIVNVVTNTVERRLSDAQLISFPQICTWNY